MAYKSRKVSRFICRKYYYKNRERILLHRKKYSMKNKGRISEWARLRYLRNKEIILTNSKIYYRDNKDTILIRVRAYGKIRYQNKKSQIQAQRNNYLKNNINARIARSLRSRVRQVVKGVRKHKSALNLLGCDLDFFWKYLKSRPSWESEMTKYNYGLWHIDHIRPCASFDLKCPIGQLDCFHYTNLRPLWAKDNLSKGAKILDIPNKL